MSGQDLMDRMGGLVRMLDEAQRMYRGRGQEYAAAERDYKIALAEKILALRAEGYPATLISDLARGDKQVAKLRMDRDVKEVVYKSAGEAINNYKLQIRVLDAQIQREWGAAKD